MRKLILFVAVMMVGSFAWGQNWRLLQHEKIPLFNCYCDDTVSIYAAISIDSITTTPNGDSLLWNYRITNPDCYCNSTYSIWKYHQGRCQVKDTGWLGLPVVISNNNYYFITYTGDTLIVKPYEPLNSTWTFANSFNGNIIKATVTNVYTAMLFGVIDSLKEIHLEVVDNNNNPISCNWINTYSLTLSKEHGMQKGFYFYFLNPKLPPTGGQSICYPIYCTGYQYGPGNKLLSSGDMYNFDVNDEFGYEGRIHHYAAVEFGYSPTDHYKRKSIILSKQLSTDSVTYQVLDSVFIVYDHAQAGTSYASYHGVYDVSYPLNAPISMPDTYTSDSLFFKPNVGYSDMIRPIDYRARSLDSTVTYMEGTPHFFQGRRQKNDLNESSFVNSSMNFMGCFFEGGTIFTYTETEGLGLTRFKTKNISTIGDNGPEEELVYYVKANDTFGYPFIVLSVENIKFPTYSISISPNPTTSSITIKGITEPTIAVYNLIGQKVVAAQSSNEVSLAQLPTGMYLVQVFNKDMELVKSEKVIKE